MPKNSQLIVKTLKMKGTSLLMTISLASILSVALFSTIPNDASAQQPQFDYRCYTTSGQAPDNDPLILKDQFFPNGLTHQTGDSLEFCNPAVKVPPKEPGTAHPSFLPHLRCWSIDNPTGPLGQSVIVKDQFFPAGKQHTVLNAVEFCHDTIKSAGQLDTGDTFPGSNPNQARANWKCYTIADNLDAPPTPPMRNLEDQFTEANPAANSNFPRPVDIGQAKLLCTPATKTHGDNVNVVPDFEVNTHLKCYDLGGQAISPALSLGLSDQFSNLGDNILTLDKLCTQAEKTDIIAGTFIPIESMALLLAGAHMSAAWILPALVASAGVGYGIEIARKYRKDTK